MKKVVVIERKRRERKSFKAVSKYSLDIRLKAVIKEKTNKEEMNK